MSSSNETQAMFADLVRRTLFTISAHPAEHRDRDALLKVNLAARRLLRYAMRSEEPHFNEVWAAGEALKRTVDVAPKDTAACLRECLTSQRLAVTILDAFKRDIAAFVPFAPDVVVRLLDAAFTVKPQQRTFRTGPLVMNESAILDHAQRDYVDVLPALLEHAPELTVPLIHRLASEFPREHPRDKEEKPPVFFTLAGKETGIVEDMSMFWRNSERSHGTRAALALVERLLSADPAKRQTLVGLVAGKTWPAFFFAMLAQRAAHAPMETALAFQWLTAPIFLDATSTDVTACDLLAKIAAAMPREELKTIETWLLAERDQWLNAHGADDEPTHLSRQLGCIPKDALVTDEGRAWRTRLDEKGGPPKNQEPFRFYTEVRAPERWEWFKRHDVNIDDPVVASALELSDTMDVIAQRGEREHDEDKKLKRQDGVDALPTIRALRELVATQDLPSIVKNRALARLTAGAACAAAAAPDVEELVTVAREIIAMAAASPDGERKHEHGGEGWSDADPQIEAADGILRIASVRGLLTEEDRSLIKTLAVAQDARVRYHIARWLNALCEADPALMWSLFDERIANETDDSTLAVMVQPLGNVIGNEHVERAAGLAAIALARADLSKAKKNNDARAEWAEAAAMLGVWRDSASARALVQTLVDDVHANREEVMAILAALRTTKALTTDKDGPRTRAHALMLAIARGLQTQMPKLRLVGEDEARARRRDIEDQTVSQLLFASDNVDGSDKHDAATMGRFFRDAAATIEFISGRELHDQAPRYFAQLLVAYARRDANAAVKNLTAYLKANANVIVDFTMSSIFIDFFTIVADADDLTTAAQADAIAALDKFIASGVPAAARYSELAQKIARR